MPGGKGKSIGGKGDPKGSGHRTQKSHSARAGLQVSSLNVVSAFIYLQLSRDASRLDAMDGLDATDRSIGRSVAGVNIFFFFFFFL